MSFSSLEILFQIIAFLFAISIHESAHAWSANRLGDPTARLLGRISLNPIRHIDLAGTVIFPLLLALSHVAIIGWAKPTPVNTSQLRNPVWDNVYVAIAGPASNFLTAGVAVVLLLILRFVSPEAAQTLSSLTGLRAVDIGGPWVIPFVLLLYSLMLINVLLAVFNLIPIYPLDGSHVLEGLLPQGTRAVYAQTKQYGLLLLFALIWFGGFTHLFSPFLSFFNFLLRM